MEKLPTEGVRLRSGLTFSELETEPPKGAAEASDDETSRKPPQPVRKPRSIAGDDPQEVAETQTAEADPTAEDTVALEDTAEESDAPGPLASVDDFLNDETPPDAESVPPAPVLAPGTASVSAPVTPPVTAPVTTPATVAATAPVTTAPPRTGGPASPTLRAILERNMLRVGTTLRAPYAMRNTAGALLGHDIELGNALAQTLGVGVSFETLAPDDLVASLRDGAIDVVVGGLAIDPDLALKVNFTQGYGTVDIHLVAQAASGGTTWSAETLNAPAVRIGAVEASPAAHAVQIHFPRAQLVAFRDDAAAKAAFIRGEIVYLASPSPFPELLMLLSPGHFILPLKDPLSRTAQGIAVAQGDPEFLAYLNAWIVAKRLDGTLAAIHATWFEGTDWVRRLAGRQASAR